MGTSLAPRYRHLRHERHPRGLDRPTTTHPCVRRSPWCRCMNDIAALPLVGRTLAFQDVVSRLPSLAGADHVVLITGETGTGKELVARAIHRLSARAARPFVAVSCGSLVDTLIESELFGHVGHAAGGTLFLDEAETLTLRGQIALLRVLQERTFCPVRSTVEQRVDVRFMAASNVQLDRLRQGGQFRSDLYFRLPRVSVDLPPPPARARG